jgi:hypothetical protein
MTIDEKLKNIGDRFLGMTQQMMPMGNSQQRLLRIEIDFRATVPGHQWTIFGFPIDQPHEKQKIRSIKKDGEETVYYIVTIDPSLEYIDLMEHAETIINTNRDMENKMGLMQEKMSELGDLFTKLSYEELKTLTFNFKKGKKDIKKGKELKDEVKPEEVPVPDEIVQTFVKHPPIVTNPVQTDFPKPFQPPKIKKKTREDMDREMNAIPVSVVPDNIDNLL